MSGCFVRELTSEEFNAIPSGSQQENSDKCQKLQI